MRHNTNGYDLARRLGPSRVKPDANAYELRHCDTKNQRRCAPRLLKHKKSNNLLLMPEIKYISRSKTLNQDKQHRDVASGLNSQCFRIQVCHITTCSTWHGDISVCSTNMVSSFLGDNLSWVFVPLIFFLFKKSFLFYFSF